ncbi:MAG TPA: HAMP domain-containing methyl-accepting chemotaxis protein [Xanthobacteraceae bacterium]|nr:HAMP domain-containing methyl-accepting chemotaxis protein [Xanthobacteraceae bacterium]
MRARTIVRRLNRVLGFDRLSILQRIFGGMGIILLLLIALSLYSWRTITAVYDKAGYVDANVTEAAAVTQFAARVGEMRAQVTQYALSERDGDLQAAQRALDRLDNEIQSVMDAYARTGSDNAIVDELRQLADRYRNSVTATINAINARRASATQLTQAATELNTTIAAIVEALAHDGNNAGASDDAIRLMEAFHGGNESATRLLSSRNPADSDTARVNLQAMNRAVQALQARGIDNRRVQRFLQAIAEPFERYQTAVDGLIAATERFLRIAAERNDATAALIDAADQIRFAATEAQLGTVSGMMIAVESARRLEYFASALAIVFGLVLAFVIGRGIARPIQQITAVMRKLADGTIDVSIPHVGRRDEIGAMAEAVRVFKDNKIEADRLTDENESERRNKEQRAKSLEGLNWRFEATASALTSTLASAAAGLKQSAEAMFATTEQAGQRSVTVKAAAQQASANVGTVAQAAEELSSSIDAIGDNATRSSALSVETAEGAQRTNQAVQDLAENVQEIERVISLIKQIAQQTNLLALNATIEAARAGQAGRGFAVVAGEVKSLAGQTAGATEAIEAQISGIQTVTANVVSAIHGMVAKIGQMNVIAGSVATAVEQQRIATRTIAQNAHQALASAVEVVHAIAVVEDASAATKNEANQVLDAASQLSRQSDDLHVEFNKFIAGVRAA